MKWTICFILYLFCLLSIPTLPACFSENNCHQRCTSSSLITSPISVCSEGSLQLILTFGEEWQKVLASQTRPLLQQGLAKKDPVHNCRPIIFASSYTATTNWFMNNFSSNRGGTLRTTCDTYERLRQNWPIVSWFWKQVLRSEHNQPPHYWHRSANTKVVSLERLCQGPGYTLEAGMGFIFFILFLFFCLHVSCFVFLPFCISDHINVKAISWPRPFQGKGSLLSHPQQRNPVWVGLYLLQQCAAFVYLSSWTIYIKPPTNISHNQARAQRNRTTFILAAGTWQLATQQC